MDVIQSAQVQCIQKPMFLQLEQHNNQSTSTAYETRNGWRRTERGPNANRVAPWLLCLKES